MLSLQTEHICLMWLNAPAPCTFISVWDRPPRSTQPGHPFVSRRNEYQPNGGDNLRLGS